MTPDKIDTLSSKIDVVSDFLHEQGVPYLLVVGIPGTKEFDVRDNLTEGGDNQLQVVEEFRTITNHVLNIRRTYEAQES